MKTTLRTLVITPLLIFPLTAIAQSPNANERAEKAAAKMKDGTPTPTETESVIEFIYGECEDIRSLLPEDAVLDCVAGEEIYYAMAVNDVIEGEGELPPSIKRLPHTRKKRLKSDLPEKARGRAAATVSPSEHPDGTWMCGDVTWVETLRDIDGNPTGETRTVTPDRMMFCNPANECSCTADGLCGQCVPHRFSGKGSILSEACKQNPGHVKCQDNEMP